ncbi:lysophospholipid acyltransferase family protein [Mucilaginibacter myungsuensis]|uniref:lysophospholipid acyltransferase family protein n=1 Tax=Mucilaginibacter myungsuensis TaxID=649104 RepID=UPI001D160D00|nr:lysophospholipid acyltransferase family protein [Mucilaginibacter myungsuensis]MDN3597077.1 lysophospholipid acyltransferase family protein [Mucilaginibacter myungsuensis]
MNRIRAFWGRCSSGMAGFFYSFEYETTIDWSRPYIICPNHTSNLDITAMCIMVKNDHCFMGKHQLVDGLVTGLFFRTVDIPVNRESKMASFRAFKKAEERLKEGITMIIFPEGSIPDVYPPELDSFKNGPFRLAIEQKIPIIPVTCADAWKFHWDDGTEYGTHPGVATYYMHKPIETADLTVAEADALRDQIHAIISNKLGLKEDDAAAVAV